MILWAD